MDDMFVPGAILGLITGLLIGCLLSWGMGDYANMRRAKVACEATIPRNQECSPHWEPKEKK